MGRKKGMGQEAFQIWKVLCAGVFIREIRDLSSLNSDTLNLFVSLFLCFTAREESG